MPQVAGSNLAYPAQTCHPVLCHSFPHTVSDWSYLPISMPQPGHWSPFKSKLDAAFTIWSQALLLHEPHMKCSYHQTTRSGELRMQKLKSHLVRTQSLNVLPFKPGGGQYTVIHATLTARDFFLAYFFTSRSIHLHFVQNPSRFFPVLAVANTWFLCRPAE